MLFKPASHLRKRILDMSANAVQHVTSLEKHSENAVITLARELVEAGRRNEACELLRNSCVDDPAHREAYEYELARIDGRLDHLHLFQQAVIADTSTSYAQPPRMYQSYVRHVPMADSTRGIRLLSLPVRDAEDVSCNLFDFNDMTECPPYFALSYTWGDAKAPLRDIRLNGQPFQVRQNLYNFLWNFDSTRDKWSFDFHTLSRDSESSRALKAFLDWIGSAKQSFLWIDALCIDQSSNIEKTHQVRRMNEIFGRAAFVMVWLPIENPFLNRGPPALGTQGRDLTLFEWGQKRSLGSQRLKAVLEHSYWSRLWIVQEFALAQELIFCCDDIPVLWSDLRKRAMKNFGSWPIPRTFHVLNELRGEGFIDYRTADRDLPELIRKFWASSCEDARDRVFALLGLAGEKSVVEADYTLDSHELLIVVATAYENYYRNDLKFYELASNLRLDDETALQSFVGLHGFDAVRSPSLRKMSLEMGLDHE